MLTNNMLTKLTKIADRLDHQGKEKLADLVDSVVKALGKCGSGRDTDLEEIDALIKKMEDQPFVPELKDEEDTPDPAQAEFDAAWNKLSPEQRARFNQDHTEEVTPEELNAFLGEEE